VVCRDPSRGCVPVNIFGFNSITPQAGVFLTPPRVSDDEFERQVAGASVSGELFTLPAGAVAVALGAEYRKDSYRFDPSPQDLAGEYGPGSQSRIRGGTDVKEFFGEVRIPIFSEKPLLHSVALEAAARYSDYGGDNSPVGSVFTWKLGGEYAPLNWVRLRSAYNRAIRAPNLNELRAPITRGFSSGSDPCSQSANPSAERKALCVAQGVPQSDIDTFEQSALGVLVQSGGNPNLREERSDTLTVGAVISPPFLDRFNITVDYFKISVDDAIASINANQTLGDCFAVLDANSPTCQAVSRLPNGQIDFVSTQLNNIGAIRVEGLDAQFDYRVPLGGLFQISGEPANLTLQAVASWLFERSVQVLASQDPINCAGRFGNGCIGTGAFGLPDFKLNLSGSYSSGPLSLRLQARMIGAFELYPGATAAVQKADSEWYLDTAVNFRLTEEFEVFGGIDNLLDNKPPILGTALAGDANTDPSLWDVIGRRFFVGVRARF
jgi:outer membrane receptor protein involved in Fe transport